MLRFQNVNLKKYCLCLEKSICLLPIKCSANLKNKAVQMFKNCFLKGRHI